MELKQYLSQQRKRIDTALKQVLPACGGPAANLMEAMHYSVFAGGKRLRPVLVLAACEAVGGASDLALKPACAMEMIHTYSLIHDDLPAMDDDNYRRGVPTNHKVFGEATAILAGDALLTEAFSLLSNPIDGLRPEVQLRLLNLAATSSGCQGMVAGQVVDMAAEGQENSIDTVDFIHRHKTGAIILASMQMGALIGNASTAQFTHISNFGHFAGLAFQIADDLLDIEASQEELGKDIGSDEARGKATYPAVLGLEASRRKAAELHEQALAELEEFGAAAEPLRQISAYIINRKQ